LVVATDQETEKALIKKMLELARQRPRYGYRRITALLRQQGWPVNRKRVQRLWREQGLKVPQKQGKRRLGSSEQGSQRRRVVGSRIVYECAGSEGVGE
jgi:transposase InsO family protein